MAKKAAAPKPQLVHIAATAGDNSALSKAQKEFNRLSKRIVKLEQEVHDFGAAATALRQRVQKEYRPLQAKHNVERARLVRVFDVALDTYKISKTERRKILYLMLDGCLDLLDRGHEDLQPIFDKHRPPPPTAEDEAALDLQASEMMKQIFAQQFGIEFDPDVDVSTQEKFQAYVASQMAAREAGFEAEEQAQAERKANRKKSAKQLAAEAKKQEEERTITKSVRALYMDLVKALHPDLEPDETEKLRKTELMKRVTVAYEANELLTLLRLQLELNRIDQAHLENLAESQLKHYNKLLKEQVEELADKLYDEQMELANFTGQPYYMLPSPAYMAQDFLRQKNNLEYKIRSLAADVLAFEHDPEALKMFLKQTKLPPKGPRVIRF